MLKEGVRIAKRSSEAKARISENSFVSKQIYVKVLQIEAFMIFLNVSSIYNTISTFDLLHAEERLGETVNFVAFRLSRVDVLLALNTLYSFALMFSYAFYSYMVFRLKGSRGKNRAYYRFFEFGNIARFVFVECFYLIHPNCLFREIHNYGNDSFLGDNSLSSSSHYSLNDIFCLICLLRLVPTFLYISDFCHFNSDVSDRIWLA